MFADEKQVSPPLAYLGLDESGRLPDGTAFFTLAGVLTSTPDAVRNLIRRAVFKAGKRLQRHRSQASEFKWSNSSAHLREDILRRLAAAEVELYALTVRKEGRHIADSPENYATLTCALLQLVWGQHPNLALVFDRHFTSPAQVAKVNTLIYRRWPAEGILSIDHVDSAQEPLVQLADFVAGAIYTGHKAGDPSPAVIAGKLKVAVVKDWTEIKRSWEETPK